MNRSRFTAALAAPAALVSVSAGAAAVQVQGKIMVTMGHESPACRMVQLRRSGDGTLMWFRIPDTGKDDGIMAVALTALTTRLDVTLIYDPALTSGCGAEPRIQHISLIAPN